MLLGLNSVQNDEQYKLQVPNVPHCGYTLNHLLVNEQIGMNGSKFRNLCISFSDAGFLLKSKGNPTRFSVR